MDRDDEEVINDELRDYKRNHKAYKLPKYHQITLEEVIQDNEYKKYLIEKRKKQYSKFKVEYVDNLDTGIEIKFTDFEIPVKTKERGIERDD